MATPSPAFSGQSKWRGARTRGCGSCARRPPSLDFGEAGVSGKPHATFLRQFTAGSPKVSTQWISRKRAPFSKSWDDGDCRTASRTPTGAAQHRTSAMWTNLAPQHPTVAWCQQRTLGEFGERPPRSAGADVAATEWSGSSVDPQQPFRLTTKRRTMSARFVLSDSAYGTYWRSSVRRNSARTARHSGADS